MLVVLARRGHVRVGGRVGQAAREQQRGDPTGSFAYQLVDATPDCELLDVTLPD